jgi:hypothetical protein
MVAAPLAQRPVTDIGRHLAPFTARTHDLMIIKSAL